MRFEQNSLKWCFPNRCRRKSTLGLNWNATTLAAFIGVLGLPASVLGNEAAHSFIGFAGAFVGPLMFGVVLDLAGGGERLLAWGLAFTSSGFAIVMSLVALIALGRRQRAGGKE